MINEMSMTSKAKKSAYTAGNAFICGMNAIDRDNRTQLIVIVLLSVQKNIFFIIIELTEFILSWYRTDDTSYYYASSIRTKKGFNEEENFKHRMLSLQLPKTIIIKVVIIWCGW